MFGSWGAGVGYDNSGNRTHSISCMNPDETKFWGDPLNNILCWVKKVPILCGVAGLGNCDSSELNIKGYIFAGQAGANAHDLLPPRPGLGRPPESSGAQVLQDPYFHAGGLDGNRTSGQPYDTKMIKQRNPRPHSPAADSAPDAFDRIKDNRLVSQRVRIMPHFERHNNVNRDWLLLSFIIHYTSLI